MSLINHPVISVIIPTYNYARYIAGAVNSILHQDYPPDKMEIIVVDDGSTDNTKEVLDTFINCKAIQYFYQGNKGKASATCKAIEHCNGKYIFNLDADDYFLPGKIKQVVAVFESDERIVHVAAPAQILHQQNNIQGPEDVPGEITGKVIDGIALLKYFYNNNILFGGGSTYAARASVLKKIHIPDAVDMFTDEFLILAVLPFGKSFFFQHPLSVWRIHAHNYSVSAANTEQLKRKTYRLLASSEAVLLYLEQNHFDGSLIKIYRLKNCNQRIIYKEIERTKTLKDIVFYCKGVFLDIKPGWKLIKRYNVLNRLMPLSFYRLLKRNKHA